ncbi:MAG: hypothetical protein H7Y20_01285 [Bryobacteraceae bacterium]|nr:hypothetical protein [Bryobacteraceae bacterium]
MFQPDGTATVLIGREIPLVIGDNRYDLTLATDATVPPPGREGAVPKVLILDASGNNVTAKIDEGKIGALLTFRNNTIPSFLGSATSDGELNRLAKTVANRVNTILTEGEPGGPPAPTKLFEFVNDVSAAQSLKVNTLFTVSSLKASNPPPAIDVSNGRALRLAALAHPTDAADKLDNMSFVSFTGKIASTAGRIAGEATRAVDSHRQLLAQARTVRETVSGVSLDEEAISLVMFQRAYEATARMVTILDEISRMAVNIGRN